MRPGEVNLRVLPDLVAEAAARSGEPFVVEFPGPLPEHAQRLMETLGVEVRVVIDIDQPRRPVQVGRRPERATMWRDEEPPPARPERSAAELEAAHQARLDAVPMRVACSCGWSWEGPAGEGRALQRDHIAATHPDRVKAMSRRGRGFRSFQRSTATAAELEAAQARAAGSLAVEARRGADDGAGLEPGEDDNDEEDAMAETGLEALERMEAGGPHSGRAVEPAAPAGWWDRERILDAIRRWADLHDGRPPTSTEWMRRANGFPNTSAVAKAFGSFGRALEEAGYEPRRRRRDGGPVASRKAPAEGPASVSLSIGDAILRLVGLREELERAIHLRDEAAARVAALEGEIRQVAAGLAA